MTYRALLSLSLAMTAMQMAVSAQAAAPIQGVTSSYVCNVQGASAGISADTTLYKARWSLPACGVMKSAEPAKAAEENEEEFATPASVAADEKKAAVAKKLAKRASLGAGTDGSIAGQPPSSPSTVMSDETPPPETSHASSPTVHLTLTPQPADAEIAAPRSIASKPARVSTPAPKLPANEPENVVSPAPSSLSNTPESPLAPLPGMGAPMPGASPPSAMPNMRPSKTAAKGNTQANAPVVKNSRES